MEGLFERFHRKKKRPSNDSIPPTRKKSSNVKRALTINPNSRHGNIIFLVVIATTNNQCINSLIFVFGYTQ